MSSIQINGNTSGSITIEAPAVAGTNTITLPASSGTLLDSTSTLDATKLTGDLPAISGANLTGLPGINSGTAVASTSGTSIDFTGIPSGTKRITVMLSGVSTNGTSNIECRIGSGSIETAGYNGSGMYSISGASPNVGISSTGFKIDNWASAASIRSGILTLHLTDTNDWVFSAVTSTSNSASVGSGSGSKTISGTLDRLRITTVNGTDTFDAGSINILYE